MPLIASIIRFSFTCSEIFPVLGLDDWDYSKDLSSALAVLLSVRLGDYLYSFYSWGTRF